MQCIVLCAGFATRLHPLTLNQPKHLLPVGKLRVLDMVMARLAEAGLSQAAVVCNHRFFDHYRKWQHQSELPVKVNLIDNGVSQAHQRRGSVGDLHMVLEQMNMDQDFMVLHGDNLFTFPLQPILAAFHNKGNILATYDVQTLVRARRGAQITCDVDGRVVDLVEKPTRPNSTRVSIGIYAFDHCVRHQLSRYITLGLPTDRTGDFMAWLYKQVPLYAHSISKEAGKWFDIGTHDDYRQAIESLSRPA